MADKHQSDGETVPGPHGGKLMRYPPGSNGGVHRGPDRHPRITQAQFLRALVMPQRRKRKKADGTTETIVVEMAMNEDVVTALQLIAERAAKGRNIKEFLKMLELEEKSFRNGNGHKSGHGPAAAAGPIAPHFIRPEQPPAAAERETPSQRSAPGTIIVGGEEYA